MKMKNTRQFIAILGCVIGGSVLLHRSIFVPIPQKEDLTELTGFVASIDMEKNGRMFSGKKHPVIRFQEDTQKYSYLDWFPNPKKVNKIRTGDHITILSDKGRYNWIWEIRIEEYTIIDYDSVREAVFDNRKFDPLLGGGLLAIGLIFGYRRLSAYEAKERNIK